MPLVHMLHMGTSICQYLICQHGALYQIGAIGPGQRRTARSSESPSLWSRMIDRLGGRFWVKTTAFAPAIILIVVSSRRWRTSNRNGSLGEWGFGIH